MRTRTLTIALLAVMLAAFGLTVAPNADAQGDPTRPLTEEPRPLTTDPSQVVVLHTVTPSTCTVLTTGVCLESFEIWSCPAGMLGENPLSHAARNRLAPTYAENIADPQPVALAYRNTHCVFEFFEPRTPTSVAVGVSVNVVPSIVCPEGSDGFAVMGESFCVASPTVVSPVTPVAVPVPVFTG